MSPHQGFAVTATYVSFVAGEAYFIDQPARLYIFVQYFSIEQHKGVDLN